MVADGQIAVEIEKGRYTQRINHHPILILHKDDKQGKGNNRNKPKQPSKIQNSKKLPLNTRCTNMSQSGFHLLPWEKKNAVTVTVTLSTHASSYMMTSSCRSIAIISHVKIPPFFYRI